ncbi:phospholipase D [Caerostris extrusa]|uniref:Phospholipase D n=1 Tax=Caerostris extrusa TaxID=172846 RepID=A0AAV4WND4_CAEEX|nr:phospholipase D [Caerostris extrusa]
MASNKFANELRDPSSIVFSKGVWMETAINNTEIYEDVFYCVPTDKAHSFRELRMLQLEPCLADTNPEQAKEKLKNICGYLGYFRFSSCATKNWLLLCLPKNVIFPFLYGPDAAEGMARMKLKQKNKFRYFIFPFALYY